MRPWHVTWSTEGRLPFFPSDELRLEAVRRLAAAGGEQLSLFCVVDEHVHAVLYGSRSIVARRVRAMTRTLRRLAVVELESPRIRPVQGRNHMLSVFSYLLRQPVRHGLQVHPALWNGSCLVDLVGARVVPGLRLGLREVLPRAGAGDALASVGLSREPLSPASTARITSLGAHELARVAAAAAGATLPLRGQRPGVMGAKRAACVLAARAGLPLRQVAEAGGFSWRTARRLAAEDTDQGYLHATLVHVALEDRARHAVFPEPVRL